jgi:hypothetical protein
MRETGAASRYGRLDPDGVRRTVDLLVTRIRARFPDRHLGDVADELRRAVDDVDDQATSTRKRHRVVRTTCLGLVALVVALTLLALGLAVRDAVPAAGSLKAFEWLPVVESAVNDAVFAVVAVYFLVSFPARLDRRKILGSLHRLRTLAHVVDMHQLTKNPERLRPGFHRTDASVTLDLGVRDLASYLDYCSELLSLVAKTAALCAEESTDAVVLDTVSEIESLTLGMSRKIWQKISLLPRD